ncbi:hypothetical protein AAVH_34244 [Aphelenchoides avenae]|nr:hypothetical protein AAVH_34244 [Aphelenchus avenae]
MHTTAACTILCLLLSVVSFASSRPHSTGVGLLLKVNKINSYQDRFRMNRWKENYQPEVNAMRKRDIDRQLRSSDYSSSDKLAALTAWYPPQPTIRFG